MANTLVGLLLLVCCVGVVICDTDIYVDGLLNGFQDWGWGTKAEKDSAQKHGGSSSFSFVPASWSAIYLRGDINAATFQSIEFWIYRPAGSTDKVNFNLINVNGGIVGQDLPVSSYTGGSWAAGAWVKGTVKLSDFASAGSLFSGLWFQCKEGTDNKWTVYVDDVKLISKSGSATTPSPTSAPTTTTKPPATTTKPPATTTKPPATTTKPPATTTKPPATTTKPPTTTTKAPATTTKPPTSGGDAEIQKLYSTATSGDGTYYGPYGGGGACLLDPLPPNGQSSAINNTVAIGYFWDSRTCGMCVQITGSGEGSGASPIKGVYTVFVNNQCPECGPGIDFGTSGDGRWKISWKAVPCPLAGNILYKYKEGSSQYWLAIQASNTKYPVYKMEIKSGGNWVNLPRKAYNYFGGESVNPAATVPVEIRMTSVMGEVLTDKLDSITNGKTYTGSVQFS